MLSVTNMRFMLNVIMLSAVAPLPLFKTGVILHIFFPFPILNHIALFVTQHYNMQKTEYQGVQCTLYNKLRRTSTLTPLH
jgi:hypothetical protein